jgi:hypothetical protein
VHCFDFFIPGALMQFNLSFNAQKTRIPSKKSEWRSLRTTWVGICVMRVNQLYEFFCAILEKIGDTMSDGWRTRLSNLMGKCDAQNSEAKQK